jgi:hypothetical protein
MKHRQNKERILLPVASFETLEVLRADDETATIPGTPTTEK